MIKTLREIKNKFSDILCSVENNLDVIIISETKLGSSFSDSQFLLERMKKPYRLNVSAKKGGLLVIVNKDNPSKYLPEKFPSSRKYTGHLF